MPGSDLLLANCGDGGSAGDSHVIGVAAHAGIPDVVLRIWCGRADWRIEADTIVVTSAIEDVPYPDTTLR